MAATLTSPRSVPAENERIAKHLALVADLLEAQGANQYRVQAWRGGSAAIRGLGRPAADLLRDEGLDGLDRLPGIGPSLARAIRELVETGKLATLERLRGETDPLSAIASVPGVGPILAERVRQALGIDSLEELEAAAHDGRLADVPGFGDKRIAGIKDALASRLGAGRRAAARVPTVPPVDEILDVDREYRDQAQSGKLPLISPRRFNPQRERWLPILHTTRGDRHYTALYSNTAVAHRLDRVRDWVVLYFDGGDGERQCTVVTEFRGALRGERVVRGRERECFDYYGLGAARPEAVSK